VTIIPFTKPDGTLDVNALLSAFTTFYRENSAIWLNQFEYKEAGPHLLMMAFLQRVINGGGVIHREYALGTGRVDILIRWRDQTIVIELKIRHSAKTMSQGLLQTARYMDSSCATAGHLLIFDRDLKKTWDEKIFQLKEAVNGKIIYIWGL
jgi:Holliday junction resolvase-like predicted endonuclease